MTDWLALRVKRPRPPAPSVLIVDDEESVRELLRRSVAGLGYEPTVAEDAESAAQLLVEHPHVALVDVHLPGASGLWLADQIRADSPTTAIVFVTGDRHVPPTETLRPQVSAYLVKPFTVETLKEAIETAIAWSEEQRRRN